ncbi:hypothetical protein E2C01_020676 [Portunus trituberculatus]|uniref:Uncharacterized protein n=1 Tax=Portunus trituberculatus TaxID=210409 RepID=A0A5B7E2Z4_PORTR|nr:hypothetical protein [Portunus trituberculatus]
MHYLYWASLFPGHADERTDLIQSKRSPSSLNSDLMTCFMSPYFSPVAWCEGKGGGEVVRGGREGFGLGR